MRVWARGLEICVTYFFVSYFQRYKEVRRMETQPQWEKPIVESLDAKELLEEFDFGCFSFG